MKKEESKTKTAKEKWKADLPTTSKWALQESYIEHFDVVGKRTTFEEKDISPTVSKWAIWETCIEHFGVVEIHEYCSLHSKSSKFKIQNRPFETLSL